MGQFWMELKKNACFSQQKAATKSAKKKKIIVKITMACIESQCKTLNPN